MGVGEMTLSDEELGEGFEDGVGSTPMMVTVDGNPKCGSAMQRKGRIHEETNRKTQNSS
jgi:hypothetical protein